MRKPDYVYQDNALGKGPAAAKLSDEQAEQRQHIEDVLMMPGYRALHEVMVSAMQEATVSLCDVTLSDSMLRYYQGVIRGIKNVQNKFVAMSKEGYYVDGPEMDA